MESSRSWAWRIVVLLGLSATTVVGFMAATGHMRGWQLSGSHGSTSPGDGDEGVSVEAMLTNDQAARVRGLAREMFNPSGATEAVAQLRDYFERLVRDESPAAPPSMALYVECLAPRYSGLDSETRRISLALLSDVFGWFGSNPSDCWPALLSPSQTILQSAMGDSSPDVALSAIQFVGACWEWSPPNLSDAAQRKALGTWKAELHTRCVELLRSDQDRIRAAAGVVVVRVPIDSAASRGLMLLNDERPGVRRAVLLALAERPELLSSEDVVGFLRDPSAAVRNGADIVLTSRGLSAEQIALATRATDPSPLVRAQVPRHIVESDAVDRVVWLTHLSRDIIAEVRIEAAQALGEIADEDCLARLEEMAEADPDRNVRRLAEDLFRNATMAESTSSVETVPDTIPPLRIPKTKAN